MEISQSEKQKKNEEGHQRPVGQHVASTPTRMSWESYDMERTQEKCQQINRKYWMKIFQI